MNEHQQKLLKDLLTKPTMSPAFVNLIGVHDDIRKSIQISPSLLYSENIWNRSGEYPGLRPADVTLNFARIVFDDGSNVTDPGKSIYFRSVKEFIYSMIFDPPAYPPKWSTVCGQFHKGVSRLVRYMECHGFARFSDLGPSDLSAFLEELAATPSASGKPLNNRALRARATGLNWLYEQAAKLEDGLLFDPFAEYGSISQWSSKCCEVNMPRKGTVTVEIPDSVAKEIFNCALEDLAIADTLDKIEASYSVYKPQKSVVNNRTIITNPFPWHKFGLESGHQVRSLQLQLVAAAYIVIAMLTGMRWHEMCDIKCGESSNWLELTIDYEGVERKFFFVISHTRKLQGIPTAYRWQTLPIVRKALDAVERGLVRRRKAGVFLFPSVKSVGGRLSESSISYALKRFVDIHGIKYNGVEWPLATHQFRKKFARIMTKTGLGIRALQDQLKHFDIEMTRGYGEINLYVELQREKFIVSAEQYEELLSGQTVIIGGGADEIRQYQKSFLGMTRGEQQVFLQELPKAALIEQLDDGLCMYRSSKALCGGDSAACRPADCTNSIIPAAGKRRSYLWRNHENKRLLEYFKDDPLKVAHLQRRVVEVDKLLAQLDNVEKVSS